LSPATAALYLRRVKPSTTLSPPALGQEWIVEAYGCDPVALASPSRLRALFDRVIADLSLNPVGQPLWHVFPAPGGITGLWLLAESHLTCHTFPEHGTACLNLFCCTPRADWDFERGIADSLGAARVHVRKLSRNYAPAGPSE
jgi:S-adenosylmethionine decarboxylase